MIEHPNVHRITYKNKKIVLVGTAHISKESVKLVQAIIEDEKPETVCVELCESRYQSIVKKEQWENTNIVTVIREKKAFLLLSNLILAAFQKRMADRLDIKPGSEMIQAIESAESIEAKVHLADRDIRTTLTRAWHCLSLWKKMRMIFELLLSAGSLDEIQESEIEQLKEQDMLETVINEIGRSMPEMRKILIDERDQYLAEKIRTADGSHIVAVLGAGHVPGLLSQMEKTVDIDELERKPPPKKYTVFFKWGLPVLIIGLIALGFIKAGTTAGTDMIWWWVAANGILAGLGACIALAHPLTILSAVVAAPLTSLNPMIAAGWVSGLVEAFARKPKVKDFQLLADDISSFKGFWKNNVTRILLVVVFTNLGSSFGTMIALPMMIRAFGQ
ncbi:pheromone shutdown protein [Candidatus Magnetomorum sp. HK-1]|nr:pheromone shutdown protein [Candidatus Magnetomorum sp. HK-1]